MSDLLEAIADLHAAAGSGEELTDPAALPRALTPLALALLSQPSSGAADEHLRGAADALRHVLAGNTVTYVVNRNLNVSNHCIKHCSFCAFRRDAGEPGAYWLDEADLERRAAEACDAGATELCIQGGLNPAATVEGSQLAYAERLLQRLQQAAPGLHLHAFSPQELLYFAQHDGVPLDHVLERLQAAGLGSVPGTAAEVLSEPVRRVLCPEKLTARDWVAVMLQVHQHGLPSTSTLMAGHIEGPADRAAHLLTLVAVQRYAWQHQRQGFTEFVLLPFVGASAPAALRARVRRDQPDAAAMLRLTAQARILLGPWFPFHQPSWVKLTLAGATEALRWGCNDLGGTLMEEHITTMAGASGGTCQSPEALEAAARQLGRPVRRRTTLYGDVA
ncbi:CofH family radical SAM protein [Cyanobium sp. Alchichica 3B3-8F6]|nr:CofH family radical SAM protein [Cyanobium sp. Alchichica 3B3-8F6]